MNPQLSTFLWLAPLIIGAIIALTNADGANEATEKAEAWLKRRQIKTAAKRGWFSKLVITPLLWVIVQFSDWTDSLSHRGLKNGLRVAMLFYFIALWVFILLNILSILIPLAVVIGIIYFGVKHWLETDPNARQGYESARRILGSTEPDTRINQETGIIQKRGILGWEDTDQRVDPDTGRYQERGFMGWDDTDTRVDPESGVIQERGFLGYDDTDTRINPETGVIQKRGMLGWDDTNERIHPETGRHQKMGVFGWEDS